MTVADAFRRAVAHLGSQRAVASATGRAGSWVSDGVNGRLRFVTVSDAFAIEEATGGAVSARDFCTDEKRGTREAPVAKEAA